MRGRRVLLTVSDRSVRYRYRVERLWRPCLTPRYGSLDKQTLPGHGTHPMVVVMVATGLNVLLRRMR